VKNTGKKLSTFLLSSLTLFGLIDYALWETKLETMSQWVIKTSKENKLAAVAWLAFCILIFIIALVLPFHWELHRILPEHF
jgi:hypothetical protein